MENPCKNFSIGSAEYVVAHAKWRRSRGKNISAIYQGIRNPRLALQEAQKDLLHIKKVVNLLFLPGKYAKKKRIARCKTPRCRRQ